MSTVADPPSAEPPEPAESAGAHAPSGPNPETAGAGRTLAGARAAGRNAAVDGLRGLALLGMLLWHARVDWMKGGFARMTIFFVLSGFLATVSYERIRQRDADGAFRRFWVRRARRLLPTTLLGVALAAIVTVTVGTADARRDLAGDVAATLANVVNWRFIREGRPYGALFERPSSLQHFWSLAVEEQCFWLLPPILALTGIGVLAGSRSGRARARVRQRRMLLGVVVVLGMIPVVFDLDPDTVYYGTHVRGAEFLLGALMALWLAPGATGEPAEERVRWVRWAGPVGLAVLVTVMFTIDRTQTWLYHGGLGLFAIPAAAAVGGAVHGAPGLRQVLSLPVFRHPGRWALSIYALHWPLFQVIDHWFPDASAAPLVLGKLAVGITVGAVVFHFYEQPLSLAGREPRNRLGAAWGRDRVALPAMAAVATVILLASLTVNRPRPELDFAGAVEAQEAQATVSVPPTVPPEASIPMGSPENPWRVGVFGSSSGLLLGYTMSAWIRDKPGFVDVGGDTGLGCGFLLDGERREPLNDRPDGALMRPSEKCDWRVRWPFKATAVDVTMAIVIPGRWDTADWRLDGSDAMASIEDPAFAALVREQVEAAITSLQDSGAQRVVLVTVPLTGPGRSGRIPEDRAFSGDDPARIAAFNQMLRDIAAEDDTIRVVEFAAWADALSPERNAELFPDGIHASTDTGPVVWREYLGPAIDALDWSDPES